MLWRMEHRSRDSVMFVFDPCMLQPQLYAEGTGFHEQFIRVESHSDEWKLTRSTAMYIRYRHKHGKYACTTRNVHHPHPTIGVGCHMRFIIVALS